MSRNNTVTLSHHTRLIEAHDGTHLVIVETNGDVDKVAAMMKKESTVALRVGRGGLLRLLPFQAERFTHLPPGSVFPIRTEGSGVMKFIK